MNRKLSLLASFLARLLEYPTDHLADDGWPFARLLRPLVVGLLALIVVVGAGPSRLHAGDEATEWRCCTYPCAPKCESDEGEARKVRGHTGRGPGAGRQPKVPLPEIEF